MKKSRSNSQDVFSSLALQSKLNFFRQKYNQSQDKFDTKYAYQIQSGRKKTAEKTKNNSSQKKLTSQTPKKSSSSKNLFQRLSGSGILNPQGPATIMQSSLNSKLLKELNNQAKQMTGYAQQNKQLLKMKATLQNRIKHLKMQLAKQNNSLSQVKCKNGICQNKIQQTQKRWNQAHQRSLVLQDGIYKTDNDIKQLKKRKLQNQMESNYNIQSIAKIQDYNRKLHDIEIANTRVSLLKQQNIRQDTKQKLTKQLKVMENDAILYQELLSQKQNIDLSLKKFVEENRIQNLGIKLPNQSRISTADKAK